MTNQDQLNLAMQAACLIQQNQMLKQQNAMLHDLIDRVGSVGDLLWRMNRRHAIPASPVDQAGTRKRAAKKRHLACQKAISRKRQGK